MKTSLTSYSFGFIRDDGDLTLIATLNNKDDVFICHSKLFAEAMLNVLKIVTNRDDIIMLERDDAPDYVENPTLNE